MAWINLPKKKRQKRDGASRKERRKIYNKSKWQKLRDAKIMNDPFCEVCEAKGIITPAEDVHHRVSFMDKEGDERIALAYDYNNLQSICKSCHGKEHSNE